MTNQKTAFGRFFVAPRKFFLAFAALAVYNAPLANAHSRHRIGPTASDPTNGQASRTLRRNVWRMTQRQQNVETLLTK
ncbi:MULTISPECIES: hypothetical protein [unclassified Cupriavidus]|uniref:hypothetical protein n=1 Tax=unclassified Cupriavidus TaxID=2640874 RepID=UPI0012EE466B|nr:MULTISPECIES: hypothetical protein [unclassified Cupriavidus]MCD9121607.1 hypothetical protein [Cupriavidus sp. UGS-1]